MIKEKKTIYIIPGYGESTRTKNYQEIIKFAKSNKYEVSPINIVWNTDKTMVDYIKEVEKQLSKDNQNDILLGFSFGAYIAYIISKKKIFGNYIFCTISPYFKENLKDIPQESKDYFGKKFIEKLKKYSIHGGNKNNAYFLVGEKDWDLAIKTNRKAENKWLGKSEFIIVKKAGHELGHTNYIKKVIGIIKKPRD